MTQFASISTFLTLGNDVDQGAFRTWALDVEANIRDKLAAARQYYVDPAGNDSNDGLSPGSPFLTGQRAADVIGSLDTNIYLAQANFAAGTYAPFTVKQPAGGGKSIFSGNPSSPGSVIISATNANAIVARGVRNVELQGFKVTTTTGGAGIIADEGAVLLIREMEYGACAWQHLIATGGALVTRSGNYKISGGAQSHMWAENGAFVSESSNTVTITGAPAFSTAYALVTRGAGMLAAFNTYSGSATGPRYFVDQNGTLTTFGATLPGSTAGSTATGGQIS